MMRTVAAVVTTLVTSFVATGSVVVNDLVRVRGIRDNHLVGLGLVVGLNGTGDSSEATRSAVRRFGAACGFDGGEMGSPNSALVVVTAEFTPFLHEGARVDVKVAAHGDAKSLAGGTLISTPLWAGSREAVYVRAQGAITSCEAGDRAAAGIVDGGGIVEREMPPSLLEEFNSSFEDGRATLDLRRPSAQAAAAVADAIARAFGSSDALVAAKAVSPGEVSLAFGAVAREDGVRFLAEVLQTPVDFVPPARIVINERTGTVAASGSIEIAPAAVTTGSLSIVVGSIVSAPGGKTMPDGPPERSMVSLPEGMSLQRLVRELNRIQVSTGDIVAVLRGLVEVGAIQAEIVVE